MTNSIPHTGLGLEGCGLGLGLALGMCLWPWLSNNDIADDLEKPIIAPNYPNLYTLHRFSYLCNGCS